MTYPQGGYPDDPQPADANSPFGYPDQPANPSSPAPYQPPPANSGWPDSAPVTGPTAPGGYGPTPPYNNFGDSVTGPPMGPPPPNGFGPSVPGPAPKSNVAGWIIGGAVAVVLLLVLGVGGVIFFVGLAADEGDSTADSPAASAPSAATAAPTPSQSPTPTVSAPDVMGDYYDAVLAHDVDGAYATLCADAQGSQSAFFGSYTEDEFWEIVDNSVYTVGDEHKKDDENTTVDVHQEIQGTEYEFSGDLLLESGEWKICNWSTPSEV